MTYMQTLKTVAATLKVCHVRSMEDEDVQAAAKHIAFTLAERWGKDPDKVSALLVDIYCQKGD